MSNTPNLVKAILDTFKINSSGIFLKYFHIQRTQEALLCAGANIPSGKIETIYNLIEKQNNFEASKIGRLTFQISTAEFNLQILEMNTLKPILKLDPILNLKQKSGTGPQNYKWADRDFWNKINLLRSPAADDVLTINKKMHVVETSRFNLFFFDPARQRVLTPTLSSGCIHGVYRRWALANNFITLPNLGPITIFEEDILFSEIDRYQIFVANSVREVLSAELLKS